MKLFLITVLLLISVASSGHGVGVGYDESGMFIINPTDHWHVCVIGHSQFEVAPFSQSRSYPRASWSCF